VRALFALAILAVLRREHHRRDDCGMLREHPLKPKERRSIESARVVREGKSVVGRPINRRSRGTVQSDRWSGKASMLAGSKLIAVRPVLGWWERHDDIRTKSMSFSLIVSIVAPGIYASVQAELAALVPIEVG
jgi:hypothetical protein